MMSAAEMAEMVRVLADAGLDVNGIVDACERVAAAGKSIDVPTSVGGRPRSPGAIRQARYKARQRLKAVTSVTRGDAGDEPIESAEMSGNAGRPANLARSGASPLASPSVTKRHRGDGRGKKEKPPTPPKEKTTPPSPKGASPQPSPPMSSHVRLHRSDPLFGEIAVLRGVPIQAMQVSERDGAWAFPVGEVERARQRRNAREGPDVAGLSKTENTRLEAAE